MEGSVKIRTRNSNITPFTKEMFFLYWIVLFNLGLQDLDHLQNMKYHIFLFAAGSPDQMFWKICKKIVALDHSLCKRQDHPDYPVFNWMIWIIWILHDIISQLLYWTFPEDCSSRLSGEFAEYCTTQPFLLQKPDCLS